MCGACARAISAYPGGRRVDGSAPALTVPTWVLGDYADAGARAVLAWKSGQRPDLGRPLTQLLAGMVTAVLDSGELDSDGVGSDDPAQPQSDGLAHPRGWRGEVVVVPAPSGWKRRAQGRLVTPLLAQAVVQVGREAGISARVVDALRAQSSLRELLPGRTRGDPRSAQERTLSRRIRCVRALPRGARVVLVDDVVTTGATLAACAEAVQESGVSGVVGGFALVAAPPPRLELPPGHVAGAERASLD